jgi:V/A-type H+-transporting ATPase subunit I
VLGATIALGILLILVCMVFNIINGIRQKNIEKLFFSQNGLSGMTFYVTVLVACIFSIMFKVGVSPFVIILLIVLPILLIGLKEPLMGLIKREKDWKPTNIFEFAISSFFELFEVVLSFATNTISFVRIGAYIMSHAGMMTVGFALAGLMGTIGGIPMLIFWNAFVLLLEGFIVAIQGIRLQYYEIFSRFYDGTGKEFTPVTIHYK